MQGQSAEAPVALADGLWTIHHRRFRVGGFPVGTRTSIVQLPDRTLALHSPGPLEADQIAAIRALGDVSVLLAPNLMHRLFLPRAAAAFPDARVIVSPGIVAKQPGLRVDEVLGSEVPQALADVAEMMVLDGAAKMQEREFYLPASRTLLSVDIALNFRGLTGLTRLVMRLNKADECFTVTRLAKNYFIDDHAAAGRSVARMLDAWDFDRVIVSHGEVLETGGRSAMHAAWSFAM